MPATAVSRCRRAALPLAALLPALANLVPAPAQANDRDLRATPVPASACVEIFRSPALVDNPWALGFFAVDNPGRVLKLRCALPVNNLDLSGTTNDNDISKIRVHYRDDDGFGALAGVVVEFVGTAANASGDAENTTVCIWRSNVDGTGATTVAKATKACAHDLAAEAFYYFDVVLETNGTNRNAQFLGITFPQ
jgi:hypothetical protein